MALWRYDCVWFHKAEDSFGVAVGAESGSINGAGDDRIGCRDRDEACGTAVREEDGWRGRGEAWGFAAGEENGCGGRDEAWGTVAREEDE